MRYRHAEAVATVARKICHKEQPAAADA